MGFGFWRETKTTDYALVGSNGTPSGTDHTLAMMGCQTGTGSWSDPSCEAQARKIVSWDHEAEKCCYPYL